MIAANSPGSRPRNPSRLEEVLRTPAETEGDLAHRPVVEALLQDAIEENVSDIHLDPVRDGYQLRFRIDGSLVDIRRLAAADGQRLVRACKGHADLDPAFSLRPQDGRAQFQIGERSLALRVATAPSVLGEKLTMRLLPLDLNRLRLAELGLSGEDFEQVSRAMHDIHGMILMSGPTGSGKTSTAYALLLELQRANRSFVTVEDPVEYILEGITQIQVNEKAGLTFDQAVKGLLRLDPDVIMMGEMRDAVSARAALDAADSGHVFLSTLHARDAVGTITAMRNFGLHDHEIAAAVDMILAQRLVRRLCTDCRRLEEPTASEAGWLRYFNQPVPERTWRAVGCPLCGGSGYRGRIGVFEVWRLREDDTDLILKHADELALRKHLRGRGALSLVEDDLRKVAEGVTSLAEFQTIGGFGFYARQSVG